ncbi:ComF family protein [Lysobacter sp. TY2-98]|uniref:ComF family protein n=1 Tax=Lysobacter sp. TY2-98 TaxID=2290922 RepID=UPI000E1FEEA7|nr:ComF family protein [Lysobacter sp. TY2-98]AXK73164.1 ComF family protein [Lysobacter sp. TY2-98]
MNTAVNLTTPIPVDGLRARLGFWLRNDATRLLWPTRCLACEDPGLDGMDLCFACEAALPELEAACPGCALPVPEIGQVCGVCLTARPGALNEIHAAFLYAAPLDRLIPRLKFAGDLAAGRLIAQLMAERLRRAPQPQALIPVPLHRARLRQRGFDQALEITRPLGAALGLPVLDHALIRHRATQEQSRLSAVARRRNLKDAFQAWPKLPLPEHVAIVDDVMTTGATLRAAAAALKRAGVRRVDAWVTARVP